MRDADGRLLRTYKDGEARLNAYLEDHAFLLEALLTLYEATFEVRWFDAARATADAMIERFADPERGGFFTTSNDHEQLVARRKDVDDHPIPSGNSAAALRPPATGRAHRRAPLRELGRVGLPPLRPCRRVPPAGRRPPAAGDRLSHLARSARSRWSPRPDGDAGLAELAATVRSRLRPHLVLAGRRRGHASARS